VHLLPSRRYAVEGYRMKGRKWTPGRLSTVSVDEASQLDGNKEIG